MFKMLTLAAAVAIISNVEASSAKRQECEGERQFIERVIIWRDSGKTLSEIKGMALAKAIALGFPLPPASQEMLFDSIEYAYNVPTDAATAGRAYMEICMKQEGV